MFFNPIYDVLCISVVPQPMYVNMHDLSQMAKEKKQRQGEMDLPPPPPELMGSTNKVGNVTFSSWHTYLGCKKKTKWSRLEQYKVKI